ncbi:hypothetical protein Tco_0872328 [Tanacetum coccineum]
MSLNNDLRGYNGLQNWYQSHGAHDLRSTRCFGVASIKEKRYEFLQPRSSRWKKDLEQIYEDDLEAMDLKWQLSLLSVKAKRYIQRTGKKIFINANDIDGYDKYKVVFFNFHKMGHFARECRASRNKRSDMAEEQVQTNMALMVFTDSEVYNDKTCSKTCLKNYETLKKQCDDLIVKLNQTEFIATTYKRGLATVEEQLITYRQNEVLFSEEVVVLKREVACKYDLMENSVTSLVKETSIKRHMEPLLSLPLNVDKETIFPVDKKVESVNLKIKKTVKSQLGYAGDILSLTVGGNQWELDGQKSNQLGSDFVMVNYNYTTKRTHPNAPRNMVPSAVLMKIGLKPFNTARTVNTTHPKSTVFSVSAKAQAVNTARPKAVNIARPKAVKIARPNFAVVNVIRKHNYIDVRGRSKSMMAWVPKGKHMTGNIAYLSDFKEFDGGYVTFRGGARGGRISGKGTLKTDSLDFEDVYFVNELKLNLFCVSQMCDKKNYVLFTNTKCLVLSPNFRLPDGSQILLKIPRKDNMYCFDMKNIVPKESLTCLIAKDTLDESML